MAYLTDRNQGETRPISSHRTVRRNAHRLLGQKIDLRYPRAKKLWQQSPLPVQGELPLPTYHSHSHRYQGRLEVIKLYYQGWTKRSISRFLHVSRPTVDRWIRRFEAEHFAGLQGHKPGPKSPRKVWFPIMVEVYHLQKAHPDAGEFRIWSLLAREDLSVRTVGRVMALGSGPL
jgi:transposase